jgi:hypothetical protein
MRLDRDLIQSILAADSVDQLFLPPEDFTGAEAALAAAKADGRDPWLELEE